MDKKIMLVGKTRTGKTTLIQHLLYGEAQYKKTQAIEFLENFIDTPGEYIELPTMYHALLITSYEVSIILFLIDSQEKSSVFPPNFAQAFNREVIGVVTKLDLGGDYEKAKDQLIKAGVKEVFPINYDDPSTVQALKDYLWDKSKK